MTLLRALTLYSHVPRWICFLQIYFKSLEQSDIETACSNWFFFFHQWNDEYPPEGANDGGHSFLCLINTVGFLKETSNKDLSTLAKAAFELLKWRIFWEPHLQRVVSVILSSANDSNWRTRSATLTYLRTFMYRYCTFSVPYLMYHFFSFIIYFLIEKSFL